MQLKDLIAAYRLRADDRVEPYSANDDAVTAWLNEATDEAAVRAKLIHDSVSAVCQVKVTAGQSTVTIAPEIFEIASARLASRDLGLDGVDQSVLDSDAGIPDSRSIARPYRNRFWCNSRWRERTGLPRYFIQDGDQLRLVPIPTADDTLNLGVYRTTLQTERMKSNTEVPKIQARWHALLVPWAIYRAFSRRDEEQYDERMAAIGLAEFEATFGKRPDANTARKRSERRRRTTAINWP
jgi:hypothetical protein